MGPEEQSSGGPAVLRIAEMVDYQAGAIVSRTLVDKKTGTLTLFAFADGQGLSEHTAPYDAMVQVVDGRAEVTISGRAFEVGTGEMIVMPAHEPHAVRSVTRFKMVLTMIRS